MSNCINIAICDDDIMYLHNMNDIVSSIFEKSGVKFSVNLFDSSLEMMDYCCKNIVDVILLDIDMPQISGFEAIKELQKRFERIAVIFITMQEELALQAYDYQPFWFVSKRHPEKLKMVIEKLVRKITAKRDNSIIHLMLCRDMVDINVNEVLYLKSYKHYITAYPYCGEKLQFRLSVKELYDRLKEYGFIYVNRSYIVNCKFIKKFDTRYILMENGEQISVSRNSDIINEAQKKYGEYIRSTR